MIAIKILLITLFIISLIIGLYIMFPVIFVVGDSMRPTYKPEDILLGTKLYKLKPDQVYVFNRIDSEGNEHVVIKRLKAIHVVDRDILCHFEGDNAEQSYDSRFYGFINAEQIIAKVIFKISK